MPLFRIKGATDDATYLYDECPDGYESVEETPAPAPEPEVEPEPAPAAPTEETP